MYRSLYFDSEGNIEWQIITSYNTFQLRLSGLI